MATIIFALIVVALSIAGMAIGLILNKKPLQPCCGGIYLEKGDTCSVCGKVKIRIDSWCYLPHQLLKHFLQRNTLCECHLRLNQLNLDA